MTQPSRHYTVFETASGFCAIAWSEAGITRFVLPSADAAAAESRIERRMPEAVPGAPSAEAAAAIDAATRYFAGETVDFSDVALDLAGQDPFFERVYAELRRVGWGRTTTYGTIAKTLGAGPEAARDVGRAMATNPVPLIIPCHRVLAAGGKVGGFSAPGGAASKVRMLALEGVQVGHPPPAQGSLAL